MKSIYTLLAEAHEKLRKEPKKMVQYKLLVPIASDRSPELQLNCANAVLAGKHDEAVKIVNEAGVKNMGAAHNGHAQELRESAEPFTEAVSLGRTSLQKHLVKRGLLSEAEAGVLSRLRAGEDHLGKACTYVGPAIPEGYTEKQAREFSFARAIGFDESAAKRFVETPIRESRPNRF